MLEIERRHLVNRHRLYFGIVSVRPGNDTIKQRQILNAASHWADTGHNANRSGTRKAGNQAGERDTLLRWLQTEQAAKMRWDADRSGEIGANVKWHHTRS